MQKKNDYNRHKLLRKIKRKREAEKEQEQHAAEKELKRRLRKPKYDEGKDYYNAQIPKYWPGKDAAKTAWEIAGYLPYIGTLKDGIELAKDPSWSNAGRFATSLAFDALGGGLIASGSKIARRAAMERMAREAVGHATYGYGTAAAKQAAARSIDARNEMAMLSYIIGGMVNGAQEANTEGSKTRQYIQSAESRRNK